MQLCLRPADDGDRAFCEDLNRRNMAQYLASRKISWDSALFSASWVEFENLMILDRAEVVGLLRLAIESDALAVRDLQVIPERHGRGIGTWALQEAIGIAAARGSPVVQLRVYQESPAQRLYARLGFEVQSVVGGAVHMAYRLPPNNSFKPNTLRVSA